MSRTVRSSTSAPSAASAQSELPTAVGYSYGETEPLRTTAMAGAQRAGTPFETPIPGLWAASMFQVYPHDRGQNYSIELVG